MHKCIRKRSNVSIHCVLKCHNHQRRKKIIIFTTYSTQSVRDSRRPAIYHLMPRPPCSKLTGVRHADATLPACATVTAAAAVRDCLQLLPSSFTLQKKPYLYRRCFPHSPEIILHFIPMRVHNRVLSKNHHQAF